MVAVVGCSQTSSAWRGWVDLGDSRVWTPHQTYGGGDIAEWASTIPNGDYWSRLEVNRANNPAPTSIWWQICDLRADNGSRADVEAVLAELRRRMPGATVFVSPLADFQTPETCRKQDIQNSNLLADHAVATGNAQPGPILPMVLSEWIAPPNGDGRCHVGELGREAFGAAVSSFPWD